MVQYLVQTQRVLGPVLGPGVLYPGHGQLGVGGEEVGEGPGRLPLGVGQHPLRGQLESGDQAHQGVARGRADAVVPVREEREHDPPEHVAGERRVHGREGGVLQGGQRLEQLHLGEPVRARAQGEDRAEEGDGLLGGGGGRHGGEAHLQRLAQRLQDHGGVVARGPAYQVARLPHQRATRGHLSPRRPDLGGDEGRRELHQVAPQLGVARGGKGTQGGEVDEGGGADGHRGRKRR